MKVRFLLVKVLCTKEQTTVILLQWKCCRIYNSLLLDTETGTNSFITSHSIKKESISQIRTLAHVTFYFICVPEDETNAFPW